MQNNDIITLLIRLLYLPWATGHVYRIIMARYSYCILMESLLLGGRYFRSVGFLNVAVVNILLLQVICMRICLMAEINAL